MPTATDLFARGPLRTPLIWLWHELRVGLVIGLIAAVFLTAMFGDPFLRTLVYSLCIGLSIQFLIEAGRYGLSYWLRRRDLQCEAPLGNWPGWAWMAPWSVVAAVAGYYLGSLLGDWVTGSQRLNDPFGGNRRALLAILTFSLGLTVAVVYFFYSRGRMATMQAQAELAQRTAVEAQLALLQSQLEPHMLFNTLANLRVLIATDAPRAQAMLDRLIAFLRATLAASRSGSHALADEFERINDYLALMAVRMGPRLQVRLDLPAELRTLRIPALLLQPLVENGIRHGLEPQVQGGRIDVRARRDGAQLRLTVRDTGVGLAVSSPAAGSRFGLQQVRERLHAQFGEHASLGLHTADDPEGGTVAEIVLPYNAMPSVPP
jgi:signal transduction histidine kinase